MVLSPHHCPGVAGKVCNCFLPVVDKDPLPCGLEHCTVIKGTNVWSRVLFLLFKEICGQPGYADRNIYVLRRILARHKRRKCLATGSEELSWLSVYAPK